MSQARALVLLSPGARGKTDFEHALRSVDFDVESLDLQEIINYRIDQEQLCLKYRVVVLPGGDTFSSVLGTGKVLALKIEHSLGWNFAKFAERGGLVLGVGSGFQTLIHLGVFGREYTLRINETGERLQEFIKVVPNGSRCVWLRGLGTLELPLNLLDTDFVIDPAAFVEASGKLERLGLACLKSESREKILGLCDMTGRILGLTPHPEFFLTWTQAEDWYLNPTRAAAPGPGLTLFENAAKYAHSAQ